MRTVLAAAAVGTALLAGCSAAPGSSPGAAVATSAPTSSPAPTAAAPTPEDAIPECSADVAEGVARTVAAQLEAFAVGDFRAAFALASESFRASTDLKGFRKVILTGYPEVAASIGHRLVDCRQPGPMSAAALVAVTGGNGITAQLGYRFVLEQGGWRVDGASTLGAEAVPTV